MDWHYFETVGTSYFFSKGDAFQFAIKKARGLSFTLRSAAAAVSAASDAQVAVLSLAPVATF